MGHLVRSLAIAEAASELGWDVTLCGSFDDRFALELLDGFSGQRIDRISDADELAETACILDASIIHVDSYAVGPDYRAAANRREILLSSMEDGAFGRRPADLIFDPSPAELYEYRSGLGTGRLFRGPEFIPLRRSIVERRDHSIRLRDSVSRVLIIMGGTDAFRATDRALEFVLGVPGVMEIDVVRAADLTLQATEGKVGGILVKEMSPTRDIAELFLRADMVLSAAGTTMWELAALGAPMALFGLTENQSSNYRYATDNQMALGLEDVEESIADSSRRESLQESFADIHGALRRASRGKELVDGRGAYRIVEAWEQQLSAGVGLHVRRAKLDDATILFDWRNDPTSRQASRETEPIEWADHISWLRKLLLAPDRLLVIVEESGKSIGTVRFDRLNEEEWEVSITVSPSTRGAGRASGILDAALGYFSESSLEKPALVAYMRSENEASQRTFMRLGFNEDHRDPHPGMVRFRR